MRHEKNHLRAQELKERTRTEQEMQETNVNQPSTREDVSLDDNQTLERGRQQEQERGGSQENLTERSDRRL